MCLVDCLRFILIRFDVMLIVKRGYVTDATTNDVFASIAKLQLDTFPRTQIHPIFSTFFFSYVHRRLQSTNSYNLLNNNRLHLIACQFARH